MILGPCQLSATKDERTQGLYDGRMAPLHIGDSLKGMCLHSPALSEWWQL